MKILLQSSQCHAEEQVCLCGVSPTVSDKPLDSSNKNIPDVLANHHITADCAAFAKELLSIYINDNCGQHLQEKLGTVVAAYSITS